VLNRNYNKIGVKLVNQNGISQIPYLLFALICAMLLVWRWETREKDARKRRPDRIKGFIYFVCSLICVTAVYYFIVTWPKGENYEGYFNLIGSFAFGYAGFWALVKTIYYSFLGDYE